MQPAKIYAANRFVLLMHVGFLNNLQGPANFCNLSTPRARSFFFLPACSACPCLTLWHTASLTALHILYSLSSPPRFASSHSYPSCRPTNHYRYSTTTLLLLVKVRTPWSPIRVCLPIAIPYKISLVRFVGCSAASACATAPARRFKLPAPGPAPLCACGTTSLTASQEKRKSSASPTMPSSISSPTSTPASTSRPFPSTFSVPGYDLPPFPQALSVLRPRLRPRLPRSPSALGSSLYEYTLHSNTPLNTIGLKY